VKLPFTTSYHTKFPEYVSARLPLPLAAGYAYMRWFHGPSGRLMVATPTMRDELVKLPFVGAAAVEAFLGPVDVEIIARSGPGDYPALSNSLLPPEQAKVVRERAASGPWAAKISCSTPPDGNSKRW